MSDVPALTYALTQIPIHAALHAAATPIPLDVQTRMVETLAGSLTESSVFPAFNSDGFGALSAEWAAGEHRISLSMYADGEYSYIEVVEGEIWRNHVGVSTPDVDMVRVALDAFSKRVEQLNPRWREHFEAREATPVREIHELKSWPQFFRPILAGTRGHELRENDRGYAIGDQLWLREFDPETQTYTGDELRVNVTSITSDDVPCAVSKNGLVAGFCILSIRA